MKNRILDSSKTRSKFDSKMVILTRSYSVIYRGDLPSYVAPMLYPYNEKSPYIIHIQAYKNQSGDPRRNNFI